MSNRIFFVCCSVLVVCQWGFAESLDLQTNPVDRGAINVAPEDVDRSDWDDIPWYEYDDDFTENSPVDIDRVQLAHDSTNLYMHFEALEWDTEETWRMGTYIDTDQDPLTGYTGGFLPLGADFFIEDGIAYEFTAAAQIDWGWTAGAEGIRDHSTLVDLELSIPRAAIGDPIEFDFILFANNTCCDFQMPDDIYPNEPGSFWSYELGETPTVEGDFNADGTIDALDIDALAADIAQMTNTAEYDLTQDGMTSLEDLEAWLGIKGTINGDADLSGGVEFADFLILSDSFTQEATWSGGDFDANGTVQFADFLILSTNFGKTGLAASVPEPSTMLQLLIATLLAGNRVLRRRALASR